MTLIGHTNYIMTLTELENGLMVSGSWDRTIKTWKVSTGEMINTFSTIYEVDHIVSLGNNILAIA